MKRRIVLNFHGIGEPKRVLEPGEAPYWISETFFEEVLDLLPKAALPVHLTFDDGNASDLEIAAPRLLRRALRAEVFVLTGRIGTAGSLSAASLRELAGIGFAIGSHGIDHVNWRTISANRLAREASDSKARLEDLLGAPVEAVAVPFGAYAPHVLQALRRAGYAHVYTSDGGRSREGAWLQPRTSLQRDMDAEAVHAILGGVENPWRRLRRAAAMRLKRGLD